MQPRSNFERYKNYCDCIETTPLYVEYSFYSLIGACLQRRVWLGEGNWKIFPNPYYVFVGEPGTGKTNAARVNLYILDKLIDKNNKPLVPRAPDSISVEALIRKLSFSISFFKDKQGLPHAQTPMTFISEELMNLFKKDDQQLVKFLIQGYDCGNYSKELKGNGPTNSYESISNLCLNFLAGVNPPDMKDLMARGLLTDGFLGRALFIWGGHIEDKKLFFTPNPQQREDLDYLEKYCRILAEPESVVGPCTLTKEAMEYMEHWYTQDFKILNEDRKLQHYYSRKKINLQKMCIIQHFAEDYSTMEITKRDVEKALEALERAEVDMHLALASTSHSLQHQIAENIVSFLDERKRRFSKPVDQPQKYRKTLKEIKLIFSSEGTDLEITNAIQLLILSNRVKTVNEKGEIFYEGIKS